MIYTELTKKALKLCFEAHKDQIDKTGSKRGAYLYKFNDSAYRRDPKFKLV